MISHRLALAAACLFLPVLPAKAACDGGVTTGCIVEEIRAGLGEDWDDPFAIGRIQSFLARAELANGNEEAALAAHDEVEQEGWRQDFILPYARFLRLAGRESDALEVLRSSSVMESEAFDRLNSAGSIPLYAREFAAAGEQETAHQLLDDLAETLDQIPPNPMTLVALVQIAEAANEIGEAKRAEIYARQAYDWFDTGGMTLDPSGATLLFRTLAHLDSSDRPSEDAAETIALFAEEGPSVYDGAIWTGIALGLQAREADASAALDLAIETLDAAPEREAAALVEAELGPALAKGGRGEEARDRLVAAAETVVDSDPRTYAAVAVPVAAALIDIDEPVEARRILDGLIEDARADGEEAELLAFFAQTALVQYARLGATDEALEIGRELMGRDGEWVANALIGAGDFDRALLVLRDLDNDIRFLMMAGIAEHLAYGQEADDAAP